MYRGGNWRRRPEEDRTDTNPGRDADEVPDGRVGRRRPGDQPGRPEDELFELLSHPVRRQVLVTLVDADSGTIFQCEDFVSRGARPERERVELYHRHLPKLSESGYVDWNVATGTVAAGRGLDAVEPVVALLADHEDALPSGRL